MSSWYVYEVPTIEWTVVFLPIAQWPVEFKVVWRDVVAPMLKGMTTYTGSDKASAGFPAAVGLPNTPDMQYAFITKSGEKDGNAYVVSPQAMTWLDEWYVGSMPRVVDATGKAEDIPWGEPEPDESEPAPEPKTMMSVAEQQEVVNLTKLMKKIGVFDPSSFCQACFNSGSVWGVNLAGAKGWCKCPCITKRSDFPRLAPYLLRNMLPR